WVDTETDLHPEYRVMLGRPGREGEYADHSPEGLERAVEATRSALSAISAAEPVDAVDEVTRLDLSATLRLALDRHEAGLPLRDLNVIASPAQELREVFDLMPTETDEHWTHIAERMHNLPAAMEGYLQTLKAGIRDGVVPAIRQVEAVAIQADRH